MFIIFDVPLHLVKSANIESCNSYIYLLADNMNSIADRKHIPSLLQDKDIGIKNCVLSSSCLRIPSNKFLTLDT